MKILGTSVVPKASLETTANFIRIISIPSLEILIPQSRMKPGIMLNKCVSDNSDEQLNYYFRKRTAERFHLPVMLDR